MVKSFPYTATPERRKRILDNYSKLSVGMSKEQVAALIGEPDFSQELTSKEFEPKIKGSSWSYYLYDLDSGVNEKQDEGIEIFYDAGEHVRWIVPRNLEGLSEKGSPSNRGS